MTIKIEFPAGDAQAARVFGEALTRLANGAPFTGHADPHCEAVVEAGPFYWLHHESESYGTVETRAELEAMIDSGGGLVDEASKAHYDKTVAAWTAAAAIEELDEYSAFVCDYVGEANAKKHGDMLRKAIGVYEQQAMARDEEPLSLDDIADKLVAADLVTFYSAEHILDNIRAVTAKKPEQSTAGQGADAAQGATALDEKGVAFNPEFCGKAQIPFYGSGKRKGQWKKRVGVDEQAYDDWYADELFGSKIEDSSSDVAANAFGNQQQAPVEENVPQDAGQLMKWVSEQQAANNIGQQQVTDAYTALQLPFDAIMNPAYPVAENCAAIYHHLKAQI